MFINKQFKVIINTFNVVKIVLKLVCPRMYFVPVIKNYQKYAWIYFPNISTIDIEKVDTQCETFYFLPLP